MSKYAIPVTCLIVIGVSVLLRQLDVLSLSASQLLSAAATGLFVIAAVVRLARKL